MIGNLLIWVTLLLLTLGAGWLAWRAWRAKAALAKWGGTIGAGLLALVLLLVTAVSGVGMLKFYAPRSAPVRNLTVAGTPEQVARGEHLADTFCASCHSATGELPLTGGIDIGKDIPIPVGSFVSVNLTPAGPLKDFSDGEIFRILRNGIAPDGQNLTIMSSANGRNLSDEDIEALIAYLRSQPAVDNPTLTPPDQPTLLGFAMLGLGLLPNGEALIEGTITAPPLGPTVEYGEYILSYQDCRDCHGDNLRGGVEGQLAPVGPDLAVVKGWTAEEFITTMRTGVDPSGHELADIMPWRYIGRMSDDELTAAYLYLQTVP
jgi:mono/diheme cytochrome c family protein